MSFKDNIDAKRLEDFSSSDSDEDENICRSPTKSPLKLSSVLKRKRKLSDSDLQSRSDSESELEANSSHESEEQIIGSSKSVAKLPTDKDFQFKEPQFHSLGQWFPNLLVSRTPKIIGCVFIH